VINKTSNEKSIVYKALESLIKKAQNATPQTPTPPQPPVTLPKLDPFTQAYIEAALWSSTDNSDESGGQPLDENYDISDIAPETLQQMIHQRRDCERE